MEQSKAEQRKADKVNIQNASKLLGIILREHVEARVKGSGKRSPLVDMAERIEAREKSRNRLQGI